MTRAYTLKHRDTMQEYKASRKGFSFVAIFIYVITLHLIFTYIYETIACHFEYLYLFKNEHRELLERLATLPYLTVIAIFLFRQHKRSSLMDYFIIFITLSYFLPGISLFINGNWNLSYYIFHFLSYCFLSSINELLQKKQQAFLAVANKEAGESSFKKSYIVISISISISTIIIVTYYNGFNISFNLKDVYALRDEWKNSNMPNIFNYYLPFAARITPILLLIALRKKNYIITSLLILSQLISFSFGGMKYTLFALTMALIFHFFAQRITTRKLLIFFLFFSFAAGLECFLSITEQPLLTTFIFRRTSFIPNQIGFYYFDFFQNRDYLYYSESFMRWLIHYQYDASMPHVIGSYAFNRPNMGANTGLFAEGFSQIGWLSLPVYSMLYIITFRLYSSCMNRIQMRYGEYIPLLGIILYSSTFSDGALFSVLATQGLLLFLATMLFLSKRIQNGK